MVYLKMVYIGLYVYRVYLKMGVYRPICMYKGVSKIGIYSPYVYKVYLNIGVYRPICIQGLSKNGCI